MQIHRCTTLAPLVLVFGLMACTTDDGTDVQTFGDDDGAWMQTQQEEDAALEDDTDAGNPADDSTDLNFPELDTLN